MSLNPTGLLWRIARWLTAIALMLAGLVLSVPGIPGPGFLLVIVGVMVLLPESRWLRKKYVKLKHRYPRVFAATEKWTRRRSRRKDGTRGSRRRAA